MKKKKKRCSKTCAADGPGQISCTKHTYSHAISARVFPSNEKDEDKYMKFVQTHRPDFQAIDYRVLYALLRELFQALQMKEFNARRY